MSQVSVGGEERRRLADLLELWIKGRNEEEIKLQRLKESLQKYILNNLNEQKATYIKVLNKLLCQVFKRNSYLKS